MRLTLNDVAREAGVSTATVDRVLNKRSGVRGRTREIVVDTARRLGYISETPIALDEAAAAPIRLHFVLPMGTNMFVRALQQQLEMQGAARRGLEVRIDAIEGFNPDRLARALAELESQAHGVGIIALDHPTVREAIRRLSEVGVKVVTLVSDILHVPRVAYVGIDNRAAGRLAGYVLGRLLCASEPRKVALFAGSLSYRGHEEREMGFRHIVKEEFQKMGIPFTAPEGRGTPVWWTPLDTRSLDLITRARFRRWTNASVTTRPAASPSVVCAGLRDSPAPIAERRGAMGDGRGMAAVSGLPQTDIADRRDDLRGYP